MLRVASAAVQAQVRMTRRNVEDLLPILTLPMASLASLAVLVHSGRPDLAGYALVAALLMSVGQMGFFVGSEILANERQGQTLELIVASPAYYAVLLFMRLALLTSVGVVGFVEAWLIAWIVFGIRIEIHYPGLMALTVLLTVFAGSASSLITSAFFCFGKTTRTYQNALAGPLYLLSGVLVPVTFLPEPVQPVSRILFLFWSADLLRDALQAAPPNSVAFRLAMIALLGAIGGAIGVWLLGRMLDHQRREGTMGL